MYKPKRQYLLIFIENANRSVPKLADINGRLTVNTYEFLWKTPTNGG